MKNKDEIIKQITDIVKSNLKINNYDKFDGETNIIDSRLLTSLSLITMLRDLEIGLGIVHRLDTLNLNDFSTLNRIIDTELINVGFKENE